MTPESQFARVLHTNHVPSARELEELQYLVREPNERIKRLDVEINHLQVERGDFQQFVDSHSALATPFRRLPADIWGDIFVHCLPTNKLNVAVCTVKESPLLLTAVCRTWREIALSTPRLWCALHVCVSGLNVHPALQARLEGIKMWLDRSGSRPLTLSVSMMDNSPSTIAAPVDIDSENPYTALMGLLIHYSHRWRILALNNPIRFSNLRPLERLNAQDLPILEIVYAGSLGLLAPRPDPPPHTRPQKLPTAFANLLPELPSLHSLHLRYASRSLHGVQSRCLRLTHLTLIFFVVEPNPFESLREVAKTSRALKVLTMQSHLFCRNSALPLTTVIPHKGDRVSLPSLEELNFLLEGVIHTSQDGVQTFHYLFKDTFDTIDTPQLHRLFVELGRPSTATMADEALPFHNLIAASHHLTHLQISCYRSLKPEALSRSLQSAPLLNTLILRAWPLSKTNPYANTTTTAPPLGWITTLLSALNESGSCPELEVLDCGRCWTGDIDSILEFVQAEGRSSKLKHIKADLGSLAEEDVLAMRSPQLMETLSALREAKGISVDFKWEELETSRGSLVDDPHNGMLDASPGPWEDSGSESE
ncbi:hypothetical protein PM082_000386 [Marasmius tenuissimus]|nr:hypothetical protein PM082_000386 [Marasmius tenuissimus]